MAQPIACRVSAVIPEMSYNQCFRVDQGSPGGLWDGGAILAIIMAEEVEIEIEQLTVTIIIGVRFQVNATMGSEVLLDIWSTVIKLKVVTKKLIHMI